MAQDQQFYVGQKAVIAKDGAVLIMNDPEFGSDLPGGKIKEGELDFVKELKREVTEETQLEISVGKVFATGYFEVPTTAKNKNAGKKIFNVYYACHYESGEVTISHEHDKYIWVTKDDFMQKVNRELIRNVLAQYFVLYTNSYIEKKKTKHAASLVQ